MPRRRAASTITGDTSVEITRAPLFASASVTSPVPAARSRTVSPELAGRASDERFRDRRAECRHGLALGLPADCGRVPAAPQLVLRLYAVTPLNWGRMSRPYASSVSSWPFVIR